MVPIKPPSTSSLASAVFPHLVGGPEIDGQVVNVSVSHKGSLQAIMDVMKFYGFDPVLFTNKGPLQKIRKQQDEDETKFAEGHDIFQQKRVVYIYCKRCFNNVPDRDTFSCTVIATVQYEKEESEKKNRAMCSVLAIYPHSCQCTTNHTQRSNYNMDQENGGCGYGKYEFPHEEICRDVFDVFVDKFSSIGEEGEHGGIKISNVTNEHEDYEFDQRWFMHLQKDENISEDQWGLQTTLYNDFGTVTYDEKVKAFLHRLTLWLANHLNDPDGFCTPEDEDQCSRKKKDVQLRIGPPSSDTPSGVPHLQLEKAAIISGGHKGNNILGNATDQMPHFDQSSIEVDGLEYEVSTNPMLKGCTKPFSVIIPLLDYRRIFTLLGRKKTYHNISLGELFLFAGDVSHGGTTTNKFDGYHPCFHINITSTHHSIDLTYFDVDIDAIAIHDPVFLGRLDKAPVTEALYNISNIEHAAFTHAMKNPQAKDMVKALIGEQILRLQALCIASDEDEEMSSTPPSPITKKPKLPPTPTKSARSNAQSSCFVETPNGSILQHLPNGSLLPISLRKLVTQHQTISDAEKMIEHTVGPRLACNADGSCGYHGALMTLSTMILGGSITVTSSTTIQDFRRAIDHYARENIDAFCGRQDDGNDSIFLTNKGKPGYPTQRNQRKPVDIRIQNFKNTIIAGIYSQRKNYNKYVAKGSWMNAMYVLPIIVHLYKPKEKFVLYTSQMKDEKDSTKGMLFCTDVYQYNTTTKKVYRTHYFDEIKIVHGPKTCMVLFTCINHFEAVTINASASYKSEE